MMPRTKGETEAQIGEAIVRFEKEYMGRGPRQTRTYIIDDVVFVRLEGVLTPAEEQLAKSAEGADLIKRTRVKLLEGARDLLERIIFDITSFQVRSMHSDISTRTGERIILFTLEGNLEERIKAGAS
jgi:uncharacterized protein YbcI